MRNVTGSFESVDSGVAPSCDVGVCVVALLSFISLPEQATNDVAQTNTVANDHNFFT